VRQRQKPEASRSRREARRTKPDIRSRISGIGNLLRFGANQKDGIEDVPEGCPRFPRTSQRHESEDIPDKAG